MTVVWHHRPTLARRLYACRCKISKMAGPADDTGVRGTTTNFSWSSQPPKISRSDRIGTRVDSGVPQEISKQTNTDLLSANYVHFSASISILQLQPRSEELRT